MTGIGIGIDAGGTAFSARRLIRLHACFRQIKTVIRHTIPLECDRMRMSPAILDACDPPYLFLP
ncbi:MAG: hypothetical protein LBV45_05845 [Xanthomonadaceae bacterium]|nr:hypothetical protein [Xanthomonadaceae bacterium]